MPCGVVSWRSSFSSALLILLSWPDRGESLDVSVAALASSAVDAVFHAAAASCRGLRSTCAAFGLDCWICSSWVTYASTCVA